MCETSGVGRREREEDCGKGGVAIRTIRALEGVRRGEEREKRMANDKSALLVDALVSLADSATAADVTDISDSTTQYAILAENQRKKRALAVAKNKVEQLLSENRILLEERETTREEQYVATEFLRKKLLASNERVVELEQELADAQAKFERELSSHVESSKQTIQDLTEDWRAKEKMLRATIAAQEKELINVKQFQEARAEFDKEMETMRVRDEERRIANKLQTDELERKFIEQHTRLKRDYDLRLDDLKRAADEDIDEKLDASVKRILQQNRRMAEELRMHVKETDELHRAMQKMEIANKKMSREVELKNQMEMEYARRGSRQQRDMSKTMSKVQGLQSSLARVVRDREEERSSMVKQQQMQLDDMHAENEALKKQLRMRNKEMRTLRGLSQNVVDQRSELEQFFIDSLQIVKEEMAIEMQQQQQQPQRASSARSGGPSGAASKMSPLPSLRKGTRTSSRWSASTTTNGGGGGGHVHGGISITVTDSSRDAYVDLRSLTWAQRERVLNLLFQRINGGGSVNGHAGGKAGSPSPRPGLLKAGSAGGGVNGSRAIEVVHPLNLDGTSPSISLNDDADNLDSRTYARIRYPKSRDSTLLDSESALGRRADLA